MLRTCAAAMLMSLTLRSKLALLVSLGPTVTTADPGLDTSAWALGATAPDLASGALLSCVPPWAGAPPLTDASLVLLVEPPALQPASSRAVSAPAAIILPLGRSGPLGSV